MKEIEVLTWSDTLQVVSACYYRGHPPPNEVPPELAPVFPSDRVNRTACVGKTRGELRFALNSIRQLGIAAPFDFDVEFFGTPEATPSPGHPPAVRWSVNQQVHKDFVLPSGLAIHVDRVDGFIPSTVWTWEGPMQGVDCGGAGAFPAAFLYTGRTNLTFHTCFNGVSKDVILNLFLFLRDAARGVDRVKTTEIAAWSC
jgi:hypothetical protein